MFEEKTYEYILSRMLSLAPEGIDISRGSLFFDAAAPAAAELAQLYAACGSAISEAFADTASEEYLKRHAAIYGIERETASRAVISAAFNTAIPYDTKFYLRGYIFASRDFIEMSGSSYIYGLECESAGSAPNSVSSGAMKPISYIDGLYTASFKELITPGRDAETIEAFRERVLAAKASPAFGGSCADYKRYISAVSGVGGAKIKPAGGGNVSVIIQSATFGVPDISLIKAVQTALDPTDASGEGAGLAPIGHKVTVTGVKKYDLLVKTPVVIASGWTNANAITLIRQAITDYALDMAAKWSGVNSLTLKIAHLEDHLSSLKCVSSVSGTTWRDQNSVYTSDNIVLEEDVIPVYYGVTIV